MNIDEMTVLQWGRGSMTAETRTWQLARAVEYAASMGPRFDDRGDGSEIRFSGDRIAASMGPRFDDRGDDALDNELAWSDILLQWGRGSMTAETARRSS